MVGLEPGPLMALALAPTQRLTGFDLSNAGMARWTLDRAVLDGARLAGADLNRASLAEARLIGADLTGANLHAADLRGADLTGALVTESFVTFSNPDERIPTLLDAVFDGSTKLPENFAGVVPRRINAVDSGMRFRVSAGRADQLATAGENGTLPPIEFELGGTLVIPASTALTAGTDISGSGTLIIPFGGRLKQQGGAIIGSEGDGLWLLGRVEGQGPLLGRINVMDTLARNSRASFQDLWLAASATLELVANADWRNGPLFSGGRAWLDGVLSIDFAGANLLDGDRLVVIAADTIGGGFDSTQWLNLPAGTGLSLQLNKDHTQLALAVSVTAVPEPATPLLAALGAFVLWARMRRRGSQALNPVH